MSEQEEIINSALIDKLKHSERQIDMLEFLLQKLRKEEEAHRNARGLLTLHGVVSIYVGDKPYPEFLRRISESLADKSISGDYFKYVLDFDEINFDRMDVVMDHQQKENLKMCIRKLAHYF